MAAQWHVHDDILLREALEAGVSLHALAAGVVRCSVCLALSAPDRGSPACLPPLQITFTQPFTLEQLTQRWRTLLYDPVEGVAAAERQHGVHCPPQHRPTTGGADVETLLRAWRAKRRAAADPGETSVREEDANATFSEVEDCLFDAGAEALELGPTWSDRDAKLAARHKRRRDVATLRALEHSVRRATDRSLGDALAVLRGSKARFVLTKPEVLLGRCTDEQHVDVDLALEGNANKVSRQHAFISRRKDGTFSVRNVGRRPLSVNGSSVEMGQRVVLPDNSLLEIGGLRLLFMANRRRATAAGPQPAAPQGAQSAG